MATGSGKTFTAVTQAYRLIKHAGAKRILFLVDRGNLGRQTVNEFQQFTTPDDGRKFTDLYNVQMLGPGGIDPVCKVTVSTIQRLYSQLSGNPNLDILWLKDDSLEDSDNLPAPALLAAEIVESLGAALAEFRAVEEALAVETED